MAETIYPNENILFFFSEHSKSAVAYFHRVLFLVKLCRGCAYRRQHHTSLAAGQLHNFTCNSMYAYVNVKLCDWQHVGIDAVGGVWGRSDVVEHSL